MRNLNKIVFWFVIAGFIFINALTIWYDKLAVLKNIYTFAGIYKILTWLWVLSFVYIVIVGITNGTLFKKIFLPLIGKAEPSDKDCKCVYYGLFSVLLAVGIYMVFLAGGITIVAGHKCKDNKMNNCVVAQSTLRTVWLPIVNLSGNKKAKTYSFQDSNIMYFSAKILPRNRGDILKFLFLFLVPIVTIRILKLAKR